MKDFRESMGTICWTSTSRESPGNVQTPKVHIYMFCFWFDDENRKLIYPLFRTGSCLIAILMSIFYLTTLWRPRARGCPAAELNGEGGNIPRPRHCRKVVPSELVYVSVEMTRYPPTSKFRIISQDFIRFLEILIFWEILQNTMPSGNYLGLSAIQIVDDEVHMFDNNSAKCCSK